MLIIHSFLRLLPRPHITHIPSPLFSRCPVSLVFSFLPPSQFSLYPSFLPRNGHLSSHSSQNTPKKPPLTTYSLTIFLVAIVDYFLTGVPLSGAAIGGGLLIIAAFLLLSWSTYREMDEERRKRYVIYHCSLSFAELACGDKS